jgi:hypothetical protein
MAIQTNFPAVKPALLLDFANTKRLDPRITFTRTTTATYYDGVTTAKAEENLFLYSQEFDNITGWTPIRSSISANTTTAPDGTSTADSLIEDSTASNTHYVQPNTVAAGNYNGVVVNGSIYSFSVFAKANTRTQVCLGFWDGSTTHTAFFDLSGGTVLSSSGVTASIVNAGNGWYRCVGVRTNTNTTMGLSIQLSVSGSTTYTGNGTSGIYIWGAQLEQRSSVTAYTATTTQPITNYIPVLQTASAGQARFDHNPVTRESLGFLAEEQRTNLVTYSAQFDNAAWTKTSISASANTVVSPDGTISGDRLTEASGLSQKYIRTPNNFAAGAATVSVYVKCDLTSAQRYICLEIYNVTDGVRRVFANPNTGTITLTTATTGSATSSISSVGNGWYRVSVSATMTATSSSYIYITNSSVSVSGYTGDEYSGFFVWGAQLEAGAFATSYIPTVASSATRNADVADITDSNFTSWYNQGEGTVYVELASRSPLTGTQSVALNKYPTPWRIQAGTTGNYIFWYGIVAEFYIGGSSGYNNIGTVPTGANKFALGFSSTAGQAASSLNGSTAVSRTGALTGTATRFEIGVQLNGTISKIAYYRKRLTNSQLQNLTS